MKKIDKTIFIRKEFPKSMENSISLYDYSKLYLLCAVAYQSKKKKKKKKTFKEFSILSTKIKCFQIHSLILLSIYLSIILLYFLWYTISCFCYNENRYLFLLQIYAKNRFSYILYTPLRSKSLFFCDIKLMQLE